MLQLLIEDMLTTFGVPFQEYIRQKRSNLKRKLLLKVWIFSSLILVAAYQSNLKASLIKKYDSHSRLVLELYLYLDIMVKPLIP